MILSSEQLAVVRKYTDAYRIDQDSFRKTEYPLEPMERLLTLEQ